MDINEDFFSHGGSIHMDNNRLTAEQLADFGLLLNDPFKDLLLQAADLTRGLTPDEVATMAHSQVPVPIFGVGFSFLYFIRVKVVGMTYDLCTGNTMPKLGMGHFALLLDFVYDKMHDASDIVNQRTPCFAGELFQQAQELLLGSDNLTTLLCDTGVTRLQKEAALSGEVLIEVHAMASTDKKRQDTADTAPKKRGRKDTKPRRTV